MKTRISLGVLAVILAAVGAAFLYEPWRIQLVGHAHGDKFIRGMPEQYWISALESDNGNLRYEALLALSHDRAAIPAIVGRLKDPAPIIRSMAAVELGAFGADARAAVPALLELVKDEDRSCRDAAADALEKIDPEAARHAREP